MNADKELMASGLACVSLTPNIKKAISSMQENEVSLMMTRYHVTGFVPAPPAAVIFTNLMYCISGA